MCQSQNCHQIRQDAAVQKARNPAVACIEDLRIVYVMTISFRGIAFSLASKASKPLVVAGSSACWNLA